MGIPVISFIAASSGTGKTTLIEKLIPELKTRGIRLALIKHDVHGFEMDKPGKDTWRFAQAGADVVAISSSEKFAIIEKRDSEASLDEVLSKIRDVDLVITEGFKKENKPKILVVRSGVECGNSLIETEGLLAIASDLPINNGVPCYKLDDYKGIADEIMRYIRKYSP